MLIMIIRHFILIIALFCATGLYPRGAVSQEAKAVLSGIVSVPLANVKEGPFLKAALVTQILMADEVLILDKRDNRYLIAVPSQGGIKGWVQQEAVLIPKKNAANYLSPQRRWIVLTSPKTRATILDKTGDQSVSLYAGTRLPVLAILPEGYKVQLPDRAIAVIPKSDARDWVSFDPLLSDIRPDDIADTARRFIRAPYRAGGITVQGMDTLGLLHIVYRIYGIPFEPANIASTGVTERVDKKGLTPGDILVFNGEGWGLYMGNGGFLHSVRTQGIRIDSIHSRHYANALKYGLRLVGADPGGGKLPREMGAEEIFIAQTRISALPLGRRIAYWAARFIGTPYDPDPLGLYVRTRRIVADDKVDCMYHTFRSVELAMTQTPEEAVQKALDLRFIMHGRLEDGIVSNYEDRFQYGEDMVMSGKWGRNITAELGGVKRIPGSRGWDGVEILPKAVLATKAVQKRLCDGDIIFWVKDPKKRVIEEIVGHLSIVRLKNGRPFIIHAAGSKSLNNWNTADCGVVKEVPFADYVANMRFIGAFVTRFAQ